MEIAKTRDVKTPTRGTINSAGIDFYVPNDHEPIVVQPGCACFIKSGIHAKVPTNHALIAFNKSGVSLKKRLAVGACVVDSGYDGEVFLNIHNIGSEEQHISAGMKIAQAVLIPVVHARFVETAEDNLYDWHPITISDRGDGALGSTDK